MKNERLMNEVLKGLLMAAVVAIGLPELAVAQGAGAGGDLNQTAQILTTQVSTVPQFVSALFWVGGAVMMGAGVLKLKEHAENPTQTPVRQGVARLAVGAALLTIPFFAQFAYNTLSAGNGAAAYVPYANP